jgi:tRNA(fMet)-specific endonuclease VapC
LDGGTAEVFGGVRADLRRQGKLIPDLDLLIAATALRHNLTVVNRDEHFRRIPGLKLHGA